MSLEQPETPLELKAFEQIRENTRKEVLAELSPKREKEIAVARLTAFLSVFLFLVPIATLSLGLGVRLFLWSAGFRERLLW